MKIRTLAAVGLAAVTFGACAAVEEPDSFSEQGSTTQQVEEGRSDSGKDGGEKKTSTPKWKKNMNKVKVGMSQKKVKSLVGKPDDTTSSETEVPEMDEETYEVTNRTMTMDTWTYGNLITDESTWVLQFTDGKLDSKTRM